MGTNNMGINMRINQLRSRWVFWILALMFLTGINSARAAHPVEDQNPAVDTDCSGNDHPRGGGGGEVPTPFATANQKVELADGEYYILLGDIVIVAETPFLKVDLEKHPWLATKQRISNPYYALMGDLSYWAKYKSQHVQVQVQAVGKITQGNDGKSIYSIVLIPSGDPTHQRKPVHRDSSPREGN